MNDMEFIKEVCTFLARGLEVEFRTLTIKGAEKVYYATIKEHFADRVASASHMHRDFRVAWEGAKHQLAMAVVEGTWAVGR